VDLDKKIETRFNNILNLTDQIDAFPKSVRPYQDLYKEVLSARQVISNVRTYPFKGMIVVAGDLEYGDEKIILSYITGTKMMDVSVRKMGEENSYDYSYRVSPLERIDKLSLHEILESSSKLIYEKVIKRKGILQYLKEL